MLGETTLERALFFVYRMPREPESLLVYNPPQRIGPPADGALSEASADGLEVDCSPSNDVLDKILLKYSLFCCTADVYLTCFKTFTSNAAVL